MCHTLFVTIVVNSMDFSGLPTKASVEVNPEASFAKKKLLISLLINCSGKRVIKFSNGNTEFSIRQLNSFIQALWKLWQRP